MTAADLDDPFAETATDDLDDPFADADDVTTGGVFVPWPDIDVVAERLVVLVPRKYDAEAKVSDYLQEKYGYPATRNEWRADLVVLDGGDLSYTYSAKVDGTKDEYEEKTYEVSAADLPFLVPNWRVTWANMLGTLTKLSQNTQAPLGFGHIRAGYSAKEMRNGKTFEDFKAEEEAYYAAIAANPRAKLDKPTPRWHFVLSKDPADKAKALAWWKAARENGYKLTPAS